LISYTAEALVSGYCPNERVYWISSAPTALRRLFAGQMLARACGSRIAHQRLRSRNSRHLQCCPFWRARGIPAARPAPGVPCGGWLVAGYRIRYKGNLLKPPKSIGGLPAISSFAKAIGTKHGSGLLSGFEDEVRCSSTQPTWATRPSSSQPCHSEWA